MTPSDNQPDATDNSPIDESERLQKHLHDMDSHNDSGDSTIINDGKSDSSVSQPITPPPAPTVEPVQAPAPLAAPIAEPVAAPVAEAVGPSLTAQAAEPAPATPTTATPTKTPVSAGLVVLQWLTYAFWGWTVLALSVLTALVTADLIGDAQIGESVPYGIAAVLVLLPISYICDHFYSKREPAHKAGPETLVMVIHAVLFALFGIGALIAGVFALVSLATSSIDSKGLITTLVCSLVIAAYYGLTFLRTLNPAKMPWAKRGYKYVMLVSVGIFIVLGIIGPVAKERSLRDDRLIEDQLTSVNDGVQSYARSKSRLPSNLQELKLEGDAGKLVDSNLVIYKPGESYIPSSTTDNYNTTYPTTINITKPGYKYQLCVTYKQASNGYSEYNNSDSYNTDTDGYDTYLSNYSHPAGEKCYKLKTEAL